jgi:hypothetical protein
VAFKEAPDMESVQRKTRRQQREFWHSHVVSRGQEAACLRKNTLRISNWNILRFGKSRLTHHVLYGYSFITNRE